MRIELAKMLLQNILKTPEARHGRNRKKQATTAWINPNSNACCG